MNLKFYLRGLGLGFIVAAMILGIHHFRSGRVTMTDAQVKARAAELGMVDGSAKLTDSQSDYPDAEELLEDIEQADDTDTAADTSVTTEPVSDDPDDPGIKADDVTASDQTSTEDTDVNATDDVTDDASDDTGSDPSTESGQDDISDSDLIEDTTAEINPEVEEEAPVETVSDTSDVSDASEAHVTGGTIQIVSGDSSVRVAMKLEEAGIVPSASAYDLYLCNNGYDRYIRTGSFTIPAGSSDQDIAKIITGR